MENEHKPWWLYVNRLGLDAPLIAVIWLSIFAKTWRVNYLPWEAYIALILIVWSMRVSLKLVYGSLCADHSSWIMQYEKSLRIGVSIASFIGLCLMIASFPLSVYSYFFFGSIWVLAYLTVNLFFPREKDQISYAHHFFGAMAFAYGVGTMAHVYLPNLGFLHLLSSREFLSFFILCLLCSVAVELAVSNYEESDEVTFSEEMTLSIPLTLLGAAALVFAVENETMSARPFYYAILTGAALLQILYRIKKKFPSRSIKILATLCLVAPGLVFATFHAVT